MRILIVEDDDRIAQPLAEDLKHQHHTIEIVSDGVEGWRYAQALTLPPLNRASCYGELGSP